MALRLKKITGSGTGYWATDGFTLDTSALEAGDKLATCMSRAIGSASVVMYTVLRRTATQIVCESESWNVEQRFREDGSRVGDARTPLLRAPFDPAVLDALERLRTEQYMNQLHKAWTTANRMGLGGTLARETFLAEVSGLTAQTQTDLVSIRSAIVEWAKLKEAAGA